MNPTLKDLQRIFKAAGATRILFKPLAENDNSKQQIYLGDGFGALNELPFGSISTHTDCKVPNFKAKVDLSWLSDNGSFVPAPHAQLILYPSYPEVRLSGFLLGCSASPGQWMQPIPKDQRKGKHIRDGRILFMAVASDGKIYAHLAPSFSTASHEAFEGIQRGDLSIQGGSGVLYLLPLLEAAATTGRDALLHQLGAIHRKHWISSKRLLADGTPVLYAASNGGGYTLEAELGIRPNGKAAPDYQGWEVKASADTRITLMTPEPDSGHYGTNGVESFVRKYGYERSDGTWYFTGLHRVGVRQVKTNQILTLVGFDPKTEKVTDLNGGIFLLDGDNVPSAGWTYARLIEHWGRKHANAAYISYQKNDKNQYRYLGRVQLGTGTSFDKFLSAMQSGKVFYDPGSKISPTNALQGSRVKARNQLRTTKVSLSCLYDTFESVEL